MQEYLEHLKTMQQEFLHLSDRDAEVFAPLAECYRLSSATPEEKEHKETVMEEEAVGCQHGSGRDHGESLRTVRNFRRFSR